MELIEHLWPFVKIALGQYLDINKRYTYLNLEVHSLVVPSAWRIVHWTRRAMESQLKQPEK